MDAESAIVQAATWTAVAAAGWLLVSARGVLGIGLAVAVLGGGAAYAATGGGGSPRPPAVSVDWPGATHRHLRPPVTVRPGDCLWTIASHRLAHPSLSHVAASWPQWWTTNRGVIGADPDLVRPGQRLRPPPPLWSRHDR